MAVTVVRDSSGAIPLPSGPIAVVTDLVPRDVADRVAEALSAAGRSATVVTADSGKALQLNFGAPSPTVVPIGGMLDNLSSSVRIQAVTLSLRQAPAVAVAVDVPYPLSSIAQECDSLAVYGADTTSLRAVAGLLCGTIRANGRLPVTVGRPGSTS